MKAVLNITAQKTIGTATVRTSRMHQLAEAIAARYMKSVLGETFQSEVAGRYLDSVSTGSAVHSPTIQWLPDVKPPQLEAICFLSHKIARDPVRE